MNIESYKKCSSAISLQGREKSVRKSSIRALLVSLMFPVLLEHFSMPIIFGAFAVMCVLGSLFVKHFVFETRGRSLEEIESMLHQRAKDSATGAVPHGAMIQH
ncbi:MFS transporter [Weissella confusa]|uniref:MFS transporter n=1 Tax=Weissella confusa TaxID=1583 RepID=UPI0023566EEF|nr:MFS transporter [Weissella confusa]